MREGIAMHVGSRGLGAGPNAAAGGRQPASTKAWEGGGAQQPPGWAGSGAWAGPEGRAGKSWGAGEGAGPLEAIGLYSTVHCGRWEGAEPGEWVETCADGVWDWVTGLLGLLRC